MLHVMWNLFPATQNINLDSTQGRNQLSFSVDKKNQLDVTFCILYFSSNSCSTCFGQPCAHHQELTTARCYSLVSVCAVTIRGVTQICLTVSGLCVDMRGFLLLVSLLYVGIVRFVSRLKCIPWLQPQYAL